MNPAFRFTQECTVYGVRMRMICGPVSIRGTLKGEQPL
jgi:hypothetical protein